MVRESQSCRSGEADQCRDCHIWRSTNSGVSLEGSAKVMASANVGTISLDMETYSAKYIEAEFKKTSMFTTVAPAVRGNRKGKL